MIIKRLKSYNYKRLNVLLIMAVLALSYIGIKVVDSASMGGGHGKKQLFGVIIGVAGMTFMALVDYNFLGKYYWGIYIFDLLLLALVIVKGDNHMGAKRWISIGGGLSFQPSEVAKALLIFFLAKLLTVCIKQVNKLKFLALYAILCGMHLLLILAEPDLSTTILTATIAFTLIYCAGLSYRYILTAVAVLIPLLAGLYIYISQPGLNDKSLIKPYQRDRIMAFIKPQDYADDRYQQDNSVLAIGSGKLYGKGLNNNDPSSVKNAGFLPEPHTDFISAVIGEELGFIGLGVCIALLFIIVVLCIITGLTAKDFFGKLICMGVASWIGMQTFINIGVATEILPNTGVSLPFLSYGLTSIVALYGGIGMVLNVSLNRGKKES